MKKLVIIIAAACTLQSCVYSDNTDQKTSDSTANISWDSSITPENAYSDLFLDSNAITGFVQQEKIAQDDARLLRNFYTVRGNQFAWFTSTGLTEEGRNFWTLYNDSGDSTGKENIKKNFREHMDSILQKDSISVNVNDSNYVRAELALTRQLIQYTEKNEGIVNRSNLYHLVPRKKADPLQLADSILNKQKDTSVFAGNKMYTAMRNQLAVYYNAAQNGGWQPITSANGLKKGAKSPQVTALKKRLQATNEYVAGDTTNIFSDSLVTTIKEIQSRYGLAATGTVNDSLLRTLNVPAKERLGQILLNMNRMVWMKPLNEANHIEVNIPSQMLYAYEGTNKVFEMPVIVGKEGTGTLAFNGNISQLVFNPTWNLPASIVRNEIMPLMKKDAGYLKKKNMEIVNQNDSVPVVKQLPGKDNPLGKVKFLFPNSFDIYLHDTPDKSLFKRNDRALSHGCIRVADAGKLAQYLLRDQKEWTPEKIRAAMNSDKEQTVRVGKTQPVQITYLSAWVDPTGKLNFRNDIYGRDKETLARLFTGITPAADVAVKTDSTTNRKDVSRQR